MWQNIMQMFIIAARWENAFMLHFRPESLMMWIMIATSGHFRFFLITTAVHQLIRADSFCQTWPVEDWISQMEWWADSAESLPLKIKLSAYLSMQICCFPLSCIQTARTARKMERAARYMSAQRRKEYEDVPANDYYRDIYNLFLSPQTYAEPPAFSVWYPKYLPL